MTNKVPSSFEEDAIELLAEYSARLDLTIIDGQRPTDVIIAKFKAFATRQAEQLAEVRVLEARLDEATAAWNDSCNHTSAPSISLSLASRRRQLESDLAHLKAQPQTKEK